MALLMEAFKQAMETPRAELIFFRREYPQLENTVIQWSREGAPGPTAPGKFPIGEYLSTQHVWTFPNGARLRFAHVQHEESIYSYIGQGFEGVFVDELTEWTERMYRFLIRLLRTTNPAAWPRIRCATNPIGIGREWVKRRFVDPVLRGWVRADEVWRPAPTEEDEAPMTRCYLPATATDNPILLTADPGYLGRLQQLPKRERIALLTGSWELPPEADAPFDPEDVEAAKREDMDFEPARWRCPSCRQETLGVTGTATCIACHRVLRAREYLTTWDVARKRDWCVGLTLDTTDTPARIVAFDRFQRVPWPEVARRIEAHAAAYPGAVYVDSTGVGDPLTEFLQIPVEGVIFSGKSKHQMIVALQMVLEGRALVGPAHGGGIERLWEEVLTYSWDDEHLVQDCVMALVMAARALDASAGPSMASAQT